MEQGKGREPAQTRLALLAAARQEITDLGYDGTNSNRIARRAGFAPQTFYRHFTDKAAIFIALYHEWVAEEQKLLAEVSDLVVAATILIDHHQRHRLFRRSLRQLALTDPTIRQARAQSRLDQLAALVDRFVHLKSASRAEMAADLLMLERLLDAIAEEEFTDLGVDLAHAQACVVKRLSALLRFHSDGW